MVPASGGSGSQVPEPEGVVPRPREGKVSVGGENDVRDEVSVASQALLRVTVLAVLPGQLPDDQGLVPRRRQDHVGVLGVGGDLGHPPVVALVHEKQTHVFNDQHQKM